MSADSKTSEAAPVLNAAAAAATVASSLVNPNYNSTLSPQQYQDKYGRVFDSRLTQPDAVHWRICTIIESLLKVAEYHNIKMWADYGTLLGLKRDKGVILWDYDGGERQSE